jgi:hypothetical protein
MGSSSDTPNPPDYGKLYQTGIDVYLKNLPRMLETEQQYRTDLDPQRIQSQQALQDQFGANMYKQQLDALHQLDPESAAIRSQLGGIVQSDLASGYELPKDYATQLETSVRGAQAARGNILGNSASLVESSVKGKAMQDLRQQHIQNAGNFLSSPTPEQQLLAVQGVSPDRTMSYVNPGAGTAGVNFGSQNYQNLLASQQLQQQNNPWMQALGIAGQVAGAYFSDVRLKEDITELGKSKSGIPLIRFRFIGSPKVYIGARAQDVQKIKPEAVRADDTGHLRVNYSMIDVPYFALEGENVWHA